MHIDARFILRTPPCQPGYLGVAHAGFEVQAVDRRNITLKGVSPDRLADRRALLASFDDFRHEADVRGVARDIDAAIRPPPPRRATATAVSSRKPTVMSSSADWCSAAPPPRIS